MDDHFKKPKVVEGIFYANFKYRFIDDNPDVGLDLGKPLIEINGEKITFDEALKNMTYYLGDDEEKYELYKSARKPKII